MCQGPIAVSAGNHAGFSGFPGEDPTPITLVSPPDPLARIPVQTRPFVMALQQHRLARAETTQGCHGLDGPGLIQFPQPQWGAEQQRQSDHAAAHQADQAELPLLSLG